MTCQWQQINLKHWKCVKCSAERINYDTPPRRSCKINTIVVCKHRKEELRKETCPTCSGNVQIKVFDCSIHKECTLSKKLNGIACCESCKDFKAS